jgi:hypothetical protein
MKYFLGFLYGIAISIEFLYSIPATIVSSVGEKFTELSDAMEGVYLRSKEKQIEKNK